MAQPKIGVIHYNWPGYTFEGFLERAAQIGYEHVELAISDIWDGQSPGGEETARQTRELLEKHGLKASAVAAGNDFLQPTQDELDAQIERYRHICQIVPHVGTQVIRTDGGWNRSGKVPKDQWDSLLLDAFERCADFVEELDVYIALDNHGESTNDGDWQLSLIQRVGSDRLGVNLDTMNYRWYGHDLSTINHFFEVLAPHVFHTHLKDGTGCRENYKGAALGQGEIGLAYAVQCLKNAGYEGVWCAEYEGPEPEGGVGYEKCYQWLKANV